MRAPGVEGFWHRGHVPDGPRSIFEIGSITKVFTATLLAEMAAEGLVGLDDPVQPWLPEGVEMPVRGRADHARGADHAPLGTAGAAEGAVAARADARPARSLRARRPGVAGGGDPADAAAAGAGRGVPRTPTTRSGCSATCSRGGPGRRYERLVRARICEPLGLRDTWVQTPVADRGRVATPHDQLGARDRPLAPRGAGGRGRAAVDGERPAARSWRTTRAGEGATRETQRVRAESRAG